MNLFNDLVGPIVDAYPELTAEDLHFDSAPKLEVGDVALRTFVAAKKLKRNPAELATEIVERVAFNGPIESVTNAGPYINFRLRRAHFVREIVAAALREGPKFGSNGQGIGHAMLIEHTSINPNASPHVGRARNAMIGDSLVRLFRFEGYDVSVHYYVNDMGRQIGLLVLACPDPEALTFDEILDRYVEANARAETDETFAKEGYDLLVKMEQGDEDVRRRFRLITDLCLEGQVAVMARLGIAYDVFDRESDYLKDARLDEVLAALRQKDALFTDEDERLVVDLAKIGHTQDEGRYFVLMRANGSSMYGYRDIAYTVDKMEKNPDLNLWMLGEDHKLYAQQQKLILEAAGKKAPEAIHYAYILLKEGKMSTRQGNVVLLSDFLDEAASRALEKVEAQWQDLPHDEREVIAAKVAVAAIRFAVLRVNMNKNVVFEWESSLSFTGDTGPYVQYSCARINSILRKFGDLPAECTAEFEISTDAEWRLAMKLAELSTVVSNAAAQRNVAPLAQYALDVAHLFTTFYHDCPVLNAENDALRTARAQLCGATRQTLTNVLSILGVEALERM